MGDASCAIIMVTLQALRRNTGKSVSVAPYEPVGDESQCMILSGRLNMYCTAWEKAFKYLLFAVIQIIIY